MCGWQLLNNGRKLVVVEPVNRPRWGGELKCMRRTSNDVQPLPVDRPAGQTARKRAQTQTPSERAGPDVDRDQPKLPGVLDELDFPDAP